jgi:hypothetical protein
LRHRTRSASSAPATDDTIDTIAASRRPRARSACRCACGCSCRLPT